MLTDDEIARNIFALARKKIPSARELAVSAMTEVLAGKVSSKDFIKDNFSDLVSQVQDVAYRIYLASEQAACGEALEIGLREHLPDPPTADDIFRFFQTRFAVIDRFFLSLTQSRRTRAGATFEEVVTTLFKVLEYPHTAQPEIAGSKPDYILPSVAHYHAYAADCLVFTCKRTLRERWRQVVTEGMTGQAFFLATIDEGLSDAELGKMKDRSVVVVVPKHIKASKYPKQVNVTSFENFFDHHLDPAIRRWAANGVI